MDGDHSAKTMEQGANSATNGQDLTSGLHEGVKQVVRSPSLLTVYYIDLVSGIQPGVGDKTQGAGMSMFSKDGAVGSMFNGTSLASSPLPSIPLCCFLSQVSLNEMGAH